MRLPVNLYLAKHPTIGGVEGVVTGCTVPSIQDKRLTGLPDAAGKGVNVVASDKRTKLPLNHLAGTSHLSRS